MDDNNYIKRCVSCLRKIQNKSVLDEEDKRDYFLLRYSYYCFKEHGGTLIKDFRKAQKSYKRLELLPTSFGFHPQIPVDETMKIDLIKVFDRWEDD